MSAPGRGLPLFLLFLLPILCRLNYAYGGLGEKNVNVTAAEEMEMVPMMTAETMVELNETRRRLGSFQVCALCTCCGGSKGYCLASPCCYAINCNIPNRPFGFCSFTPKSCNCFGCHL